MAILNFPNTGLYDGYQWTGDNDVTYIYDGIKWVGHAVAQPAGTSSITNNGNTLQIDPTGNIIIPTGAFIYYESGEPLSDRLISGGEKVILGADGSLGMPGGYSLIKAQSVWINAGSAPTVAYTSIDPYVGSIKATIKVYVRQADNQDGDHDEDTQVCEMLIATKQRFIDNGGTWTKTAVGTVYGVTHTSTAPLATFTVNFVQGYVAGPGIPPKDVVQILAEPTAAVTGTNMWVMVAATEMTND